MANAGSIFEQFYSEATNRLRRDYRHRPSSSAMIEAMGKRDGMHTDELFPTRAEREMFIADSVNRSLNEAEKVVDNQKAAGFAKIGLTGFAFGDFVAAMEMHAHAPLTATTIAAPIVMGLVATGLAATVFKEEAALLLSPAKAATRTCNYAKHILGMNGPSS